MGNVVGSRNGRDQFDFWLGEWHVFWDDDHQGTNKVSKILGGRVILEEFDGRPGTELRGMSLSNYQQDLNLWQQTWVDNTGNYMAFQGKWQRDRMVLTRQIPGERDGVLQRMVWFDITRSNLEWHWLLSEDEGQSWEIRWHLHYQRIGEAS